MPSEFMGPDVVMVSISSNPVTSMLMSPVLAAFSFFTKMPVFTLLMLPPEKNTSTSSGLEVRTFMPPPLVLLRVDPFVEMCTFPDDPV